MLHAMQPISGPCGPPVETGWLLLGNPESLGCARQLLCRVTASLPGLQSHGHPARAVLGGGSISHATGQCCGLGEARAHPPSTGQDLLRGAGDRSPVLTAAQLCQNTSVVAAQCLSDAGVGSEQPRVKPAAPHALAEPQQGSQVSCPWAVTAAGRSAESGPRISRVPTRAADQTPPSAASPSGTGRRSRSTVLRAGPVRRGDCKPQRLGVFCIPFLLGQNPSLANSRL